MRATPLLVLSLAFLVGLVASPALAAPGGFGCLWPINNLYENTRLSRYYFDNTERVYILRVYLNEPAPEPKGIFDNKGVSIGIDSQGPRKVAVCKVVPPHLESVRRAIYWREVKGESTGPLVYRNIDIRQTEPGGFNDWLVLRAKSPKVTGAVTIEFHVYTGYSSYAG